MTLATDITASGMAVKRDSATGTSTLQTGTGGLLAEAIPGNASRIVLQPAATGVYWNVGTASATTAPVPVGGLVIDGPAAPTLNLIQLYAAATTAVVVTFGSPSRNVSLGTADAGGALTAIAVDTGNLDYVVSASYTATITATSIIPTAFTATLPAGLVRIILIPRGDLYWKIGGAASASTALIGQESWLSLPVTKTLADTIEVYAAGAGVVCDLLVCTSR